MQKPRNGQRVYWLGKAGIEAGSGRDDDSPCQTGQCAATVLVAGESHSLVKWYSVCEAHKQLFSSKTDRGHETLPNRFVTDNLADVRSPVGETGKAGEMDITGPSYDPDELPKSDIPAAITRVEYTRLIELVGQYWDRVDYDGEKGYGHSARTELDELAILRNKLEYLEKQAK